MYDFSKEISEFTKHGTYEYVFDVGGNLVFNPNSPDFNKNYVSIPISNYVYDNNKISSFYNLQFTEFINEKLVVGLIEPVINPVVEELQFENESLKEQLTTLTNNSTNSMNDSEKLAFKQVIIDLRIALNQGNSALDFSEDFPYTPIKK